MYRPTKLPPMPKGVTDPSIWRGMWCNGILTLPEGMTQEEVDKKLWERDREFLDKYSKPVGGLRPEYRLIEFGGDDSAVVECC